MTHKREMAEKLLNLIDVIDMLDREAKRQTDGKPTFSDMDDYRESKAILGRVAIGILRKEKRNDRRTD